MGSLCPKSCGIGPICNTGTPLCSSISLEPRYSKAYLPWWGQTGMENLGWVLTLPHSSYINLASCLRPRLSVSLSGKWDYCFPFYWVVVVGKRNCQVKLKAWSFHWLWLLLFCLGWEEMELQIISSYNKCLSDASPRGLFYFIRC